MKALEVDSPSDCPCRELYCNHPKMKENRICMRGTDFSLWCPLIEILEAKPKK